MLVRNSTQAKVAAAAAEARERVRAVVGVIDQFEAPIMDEPTQVLGRKRKSTTAAGAIVSSTGYEAELRAQKAIAKDKETAKKMKREAKVTGFAAKWVPLVQKAEALAALKPTPTTAVALSAALQVGDLKALIVSRSGKTAAAKNNKEDALAKEALALLSKPLVTMAAAAADDSSDESRADEMDE